MLEYAKQQPPEHFDIGDAKNKVFWNSARVQCFEEGWKRTSKTVEWAVDSTCASMGVCGTIAAMTFDRLTSASVFAADTSALVRITVASSRRRSSSAM